MGVIIVITLYVAACFGVELIGRDELLLNAEDTQVIVTEYFDCIEHAMLVLVQFVSMDSIASIYLPLVMRRANLIVYFFPVLMFLSVAIMNIITAMLVDSAIAISNLDAEMHRNRLHKLKPKISEVFRNIDDNGSGTLTREEVVNSLQLLSKSVNINLKERDHFEIFEILDVDNSGEITEREFVEGVFALMFSDISFETVQQLAMLRSIRESVGSIQHHLQPDHVRERVSVGT